MTPLNLYLETATPEEVEDVVREYGDTIRDLAIANVFAGDMLWRNFGVNRHGRVVFYDYDEIEYLTDCVVPRRSRRRPTPRRSSRASRGTPSGRSTSSRRSSRRSCSAARRCARRSCATTPTCSRPEFWQRCQRAGRRGRDRRLLPLPGGDAVRCALRRRLSARSTDRHRQGSTIRGRRRDVSARCDRGGSRR